jgi:hypothetical protein
MVNVESKFDRLDTVRMLVTLVLMESVRMVTDGE